MTPHPQQRVVFRHHPRPNETPRQAQTPPQKHDATLNESVPPSVFADRARDQREGQLQTAKRAHLPHFPSKTTNRQSKTSNASQSPRAPRDQESFKLKRRRGIGSWVKRPGFYVALCMVGLLMYGFMRILPDLRNEPSKTVTLVVESIPSGAKIFLDGEDTGRITTSEFVGLEHGGTKELKLTLPGYETFTTQVDLDGPAGNKGVVRVYKTSKLIPEGRRLTIDSRPTNARLILDGVFVGNTPHVFNDVENRRGPLEFSVEKEGFKTVRDSRTWPTEADGKITVILDPI